MPRGWEVIRLQTEFEAAPPSADDLMAIVDAVREAAGVPARDDEVDEAAPSRYVPRHVASQQNQGIDLGSEAAYTPRAHGHFQVVSGEADYPAKDTFADKTGPFAS